MDGYLRTFLELQATLGETALQQFLCITFMLIIIICPGMLLVTATLGVCFFNRHFPFLVFFSASDEQARC